MRLKERWQEAEQGNAFPNDKRGGESVKNLVSLINSFHPGRATYMEFVHMRHRFDQQPDQAVALHALDGPVNGPYDPRFVAQIERWMRSI
jgi:hypothetical protein